MSALKVRWLFGAGAAAVLVCGAWAGRVFGPNKRAPIASAPVPSAPVPSDPVPSVRTGAAGGLPVVRTLHHQPASAYHASLFADDGDVVLTTQEGFAVFMENGEVDSHVAALGASSARRGGSIVFWREGKLREVSVHGGAEREVASLATAPQYIVGTEHRLAWVRPDPVAGTSLEVLSGGVAAVVHTSRERVTTPVLHESSLYWVESSQVGAWTVMRFGLDAPEQASSEVHRERPPALLAAGADGLYFYAGPQRGLRRLSFDLQSESAVLGGVVCSPLAARRSVVCAQVGGLFEVLPSGAARFLAAERAGPITSVAVTADRALWVAESGQEQLVVRSVSLSVP